MRATKKLVALVSLAAAPLIGGGAAAVAALPATAASSEAAAPAVAAPAAATVHMAKLTGYGPTSEAPDPGDNQTEAPDPGEQQTLEPDNPGGHQDTPGVNVDHQFSGVE